MSQDLIAVLLPRVLPAITEGLQDLDDDVRAVAAAALIPVVKGLVQLLPTKVCVCDNRAVISSSIQFDFL